MEFEAWWLILFPLCFGLGWLAARVDIRHLLANSKLLPRQYFEGLNHLLGERTDKAVEVFVDLARNHSETIELQFALGHLFRKKGEIERAIRMHQKLLARPELKQHEKHSAQYELALDFMKAGLFDRAEELFGQLDDTDFARAARRHLLDIYQQEKEWKKAIETAQQLRDTSHTYQHEIAEFYCELATAAMTRSQPQEARQYLQQALAEHRKCVRANLLLGELAANEGQFAAAIEAWLKIESQDHRFLPFAARKLLDAYDKLGKAEEGTALLKGFLSSYPELDMLDVLVERIAATESDAAAYDWLREELRRNPTMAGLLKLQDAQTKSAPAERRAELETIQRLTQEATRGASMYHCASCGFKARQYFWRCPACNDWESFLPARGQTKA
ncbi:lipopolysaccharide assembly protein LapB [Chitinimonas taiwanensis]|uniref:Lipopolysaccharide assembly protein B n=1 Tax=Chitinimonas taiwanensis DSM 18899 TaxID=1121279 RepID=A0A1K2H7U8_9NEIS|nr:lipopolysaccharide assembly protein LapB [Chitinimonas taiwanensis]SFZ72772.1 Lipopolysaccharide biosynthesis regulator YciM, contains six TPR domains and a predicted metal-binding C-terminal domain [Chitinimonas taiwanensis DSM 18899]